LLIKYIKSVLWKVAKRLSYIEDTQCQKVNDRFNHRSISWTATLGWSSAMHKKHLVYFTGIT